jgi:GNAT superfamily N-acetyltransferase
MPHVREVSRPWPGHPAPSYDKAPEWRGRAFARALFEELTRFARELGVGRLLLHATADGRPFYESVGFKPNPTSMEWTP